jgi:PAS domain S-box-containing protein
MALPLHPQLAPRSLARQIACALGGILALGGLTVLVGWWLQIDLLVQLRPTYEPLKPNGALCLFAVGLALVLDMRGFVRTAWMGLIPLVLGGLSALQHLLGVNLHIDQLIAEDYLAGAAATEPGRMLLVSAICFICAGLVLVPLFGRRSPARALSLALAGSIFAAVGGAGIFSHMLSLPAGLGWSSSGTLSPYSSAFALVAGFAFLAAAWRVHEVHTEAPPAWLPLPVVVASAAITAILFSGLRERERYYSAITTKNTLNSLAQNIVLEIDRQSSTLERIARRWSLLEGPSTVVREADAVTFLNDASGAHVLSWINLQGETRWHYPIQGHEDLSRFNHNREPLRADTLLRARASGLPAVSGTLAVPGHGPGFAIYAPILTLGGTSGFVAADFTYSDLLFGLERRLRLGENYAYSIQISGLAVFDSRGAVSRDQPIPDALDVVFDNVFDRRVRITLAPLVDSDALSRRRLPEVSLYTGLGITFLLGLSVHLARVARARQRLTEVANTQLRGEIEERRQAESALRASQLAERKLGLVAARTDNIVIIARPDGTIDWVNDALTRLLGHPLSEVAGLPLLELLAAHDPAASDRLRLALAAGDPLSTDLSCRSRSGRHYDLSIDLQPVYAADGRLENYILLAADITQRVETERELRRAKIEADAASRAKSDFLASMSHEIRTPMNGVIGMTSLLLHSPLTADQRDSVNTIRQSGETLLTIINDILDFSKIESGRLELEYIPFDLPSLVEETLDLFAPLATSRGLDLAYRIDPSLPPWIELDPTRLRQVIANLVNNAVKFTPSGSVSIEILPAGPRSIQFIIHDTGIGIPPDRVDRLFRAFSQVDSSTTRKYGGTGLGLVICQRLVELMGGAIRVDSTVGQGSTFHFTLPLRAAPTPADALPQPPPPQPPVVLLLESHPLNRLRLVEQITAQLGPVLAPAHPADLEELLAAPAAPRPTLLVADPAFLRTAPESATRLRALHLPVLWLHPQGQPPAAPADLGPPHARLTRPVRTSHVLGALRRHLLLDPARSVTRATSEIDQLAETIPLSILVVEDNLVNQKVALRFLERLGYRADAVANGLESLRALESRPYDLVFMDLQMPEMDGFEASREIRAHFPAERQPRIIALTANALQGDRDACLAAGMDDYITKPVKLSDIAASIQRQFAAPPANQS